MPSAGRGSDRTFLSRGGARFLVLLHLLALGPVHGQPQAPSPAAAGVRVFPSGGLDAEVAALIVSGQEGGDLPLEVLAVPVVGSDSARLMVVVEVAGRPLLADSPPSPLQVELFAYLLAPDDSIRSWLLRSLEIDLDSARARLEQTGLRLVGAIDVLPGEYSLRVLVRCLHSGELGARVQPLEVPAPGTGEVRAWASLESRTGSTWLEVELTEDPPASWWTGSAAPPPALPVVEAGQLARVRIAVTGTAAVPTEASVEILERSGGAPSSEVPVELQLDAGDTAGQGVVLVGDLPVPELGRGRYRMRVVLPGVGARSLRTGEVRLLVTDSLASEAARGWPGLVSGSTPSAASGEKGGDRPLEGESELDPTALTAVRETYERALERLAMGESSTAIGIVSDLESGLLREQGYRSLAMLQQEEVAMARRIAAERPEGLLPVCLLHASLHRLYRELGLSVLHDHARSITLHILDLYVDAESTDRVLAAGALSSLAADLLRGQDFRLAEALLERALGYDAESEAALLGLAAMYEKEGRYAKVVTSLERLLDSRPRHPEALLRLGVNQLRVGHPARGRRVLADLVSGDVPPWVSSISYQELAREHLRQGEIAAAEQLLRESLGSLPGHDELYVQLAMVLDLRGRAEDAATVLEDLDRVRRPERTSARQRYNQWPPILFESAPDAAAGRRLADLGVVLHLAPRAPDG